MPAQTYASSAAPSEGAAQAEAGAIVEELPGANTQGATLEEARENLREAVELTLEANRALAEEDLAGIDVIREPLKLTA